MPQHLVASAGSRGVVVSGRCHSTWLRVVDPEGLFSAGDATAPFCEWWILSVGGCEWWIQRGCCQWEMPQHLVASGGSRGVVVSGRCRSTTLRVVDPEGLMPQHLVASAGSRGVVVSGRCHSTWLRVVDPEGLFSAGDATAPFCEWWILSVGGCEWWIQRGCCQWEMPQHLVASGGPRGVVIVGMEEK